MRICFITESSSYHSRRWIEGLAKAGHEIHLVCANEPEHLIDKAIVHCHQIYSANPLGQIRNIIAIRLLLRKLDPDIIHLFGLFSVQNIGSMWVIPKRKNVIISVSGSDIVNFDRQPEKFDSLVKKHLLSRAVRICATSHFLAEKTRKFAPPKTPLHTIMWGTDTSFFTPDRNHPNHDSHVVGYAKMFSTIYGCDVLLRAVRYIFDNEPSVRLKVRIAGKGQSEQELKALAEKLGISGSIEWVGWIHDRYALRDFYRSLDIFAMPSRMEAFGMSAVEAGACGCAVIASRVGGIPEIIDHEKTGFLVEPGNPSALGDAIIRCIKDSAFRGSISTALRQHVESNLDWKQTISSVGELYKLVARKNIF